MLLIKARWFGCKHVAYNLEISVQQTTDRLARAQMLSYSLEEESERWKQSLVDVDKTLKVLVSKFLSY